MTYMYIHVHLCVIATCDSVYVMIISFALILISHLNLWGMQSAETLTNE